MVYVLFIVIALVSFAVQRTLQSKFERFIRLLIVSVIVSLNKVLLRILSKRKIGDYGSLSKNMQFPHDLFFVPYLYRKNVIPFRSFDFWTEDIMYREYIFRKQAP